MKHLGCLHAHHSNIQYIEGVLKDLSIKSTHFVDPGLIHFAKDNQQCIERLIDELKWIEETGVDVILITCTNYIAFLEETKLEMSIPILKIDEQFFEEVKQALQPVQVIFTNEGTVAGTMSRLHTYLEEFRFAVEYTVIPKAFDLYMQGKTLEHDALLLKTFAAQDFKKHSIAVAQLSMSSAAIAYSQQTGQHIINPLLALKKYLLNL